MSDRTATTTPKPNQKAKPAAVVNPDQEDSSSEESVEINTREPPASSRGKGRPTTGNKREFLGLDPESPSVVPKWDFLLKRGYVSSINFEVSSFGNKLQVSMPVWDPAVGAMVPAVLPARLAVENLKSQGVLDKFGRLAKSVTKPTSTVVKSDSKESHIQPRKVDKRPLPKRSLVDRDFMADGNAAIRSTAVANELGINSIGGRMSTLFGPIPSGIDTIEKMWETLDSSKRLRVLMDESNLNILKGQNDLWATALKFSSSLRCPFRGALRLKRETVTGGASASSSRGAAVAPPKRKEVSGGSANEGEASPLPDDTYQGRD